MEERQKDISWQTIVITITTLATNLSNITRNSTTSMLPSMKTDATASQNSFRKTTHRKSFFSTTLISIER